MSYVTLPSGGGSVYSVAKQVFNNGALPPLVAPASVYPDANAWYSSEISSADVSFATGKITCVNAGTYRISLALTYDKIASPSNDDLQINLGLTDAAPNPLQYEEITYGHFESNGVGQLTATFTTIVEATAGQAFQIHFLFGGTVGASANYFVGAQAGYILVERVA